jgi:2-polyprenyl-3-methyl-5-hydroxy-6-metoxy-1,4-benzoquinol methylase
MTPAGGAGSPTAEDRARASKGGSDDVIHAAVERLLRRLGVAGGGVLLDVGCGTGALRARLGSAFGRYVGADILRYDDFPADAEFHRIDLDSGRAPLPDGFADVTVSVETIEHLENPRALVREMVRLTRPGGWALVTTPNQLSLASKLSLALRGAFVAFVEAPGLYPAHISALLESDLRRMAAESGLVDVAIAYTDSGRMPLTPWRWPGLGGRSFSDNVLMAGRKPEGRP